MHEQEACCVLDFYVDEACQRQGFGKLLFDYMLKVQQQQLFFFFAFAACCLLQGQPRGRKFLRSSRSD
jgi:GNAT superfamily N-acetyltransferase